MERWTEKVYRVIEYALIPEKEGLISEGSEKNNALGRLVIGFLQSTALNHLI
jgi:hypothetical protein